MIDKSVSIGKIAEKKEYIIRRLDIASRDGFTGIVRFEINFNQGGIRTIKSNIEDIKKY